MHFWSKFGNPNFNWWRGMAWTSSKRGKFWLLSSIWPWSSRSIVPQNYRHLNQVVLHFWSKFGYLSLNGWQVITRTSTWLPHTRTDGRTDTQTDAGHDNTRRPKLASGNKMIVNIRQNVPARDSGSVTLLPIMRFQFISTHIFNVP